MRSAASIPISLPEGEARKAQCVDCVTRRLQERPGIRRVILDGESALKVEYDPKLVTLAALEREVTNARGCLDPNIAHLMLRVEGMQSVQAERRIERALFGLPGVSASASYSSGTLRLEFDRRQCPLPEIVRRLDKLGYRSLSPTTSTQPMSLRRGVSLAAKVASARSWARSHVELVLVLVGGVLLFLGFLLGTLTTGGFDAWNVARVSLLLLSAVCTSTETGPEAWAFIKRFRLDVDVLMFAAAGGAASLGKYEEGALLLFLFGLGAAGEHLALSRARAGIEALTKLTPETATLIGADGSMREVGVKEVGEGDQVVVKPFDRMPVDGVVEEGTSAVDQSPVTGESVPVEKGPGGEVFAGTINTSGRLVVRCTKPASKTTLARIIQLVEEAQSTKSSTQVFTDKVEARYVPFVFVATGLLIVLPPFLAHVSWGIAFYRSMAFLTAASPCALAIGTPAAVLCAIARSARIGVLIKGGVHLENLGTIKAVALDKTGTLTTGKLSVAEIVTVGRWSQDEVLRLAAGVEGASTHPLATAMVKEAKKRGLRVPELSDVEEIPAVGVRGVVEGKKVFAGKVSQVAGLVTLAGRLKAEGKAVVAVEVEGEPAGLIALADTPRADAREAIGKLHGLGVKHTVMLTGDHEAAAASVAKLTGVDAYHADLLPEDKLRWLTETANKFGPVAMVGDGINDAPALAQATVGIAIAGGQGAASDIAMETADVVLLADDLSRLPAALSLARHARTIIAQNLTIALGVIACIAPLAALGYTPLSLAVLLHEGSTIVVVLNSLRLLRAKSI